MFYNNIHTRIRYIFLVVILVLVIAIARVFYIQVFSYKKLNTLAESLWSRKLPISADRGKIVDRKGRVADNITTTSLVVIPNQIKDKEDTAKKLSKILKSDYNDMLKHVSKKTSIERVHPEGRGLSYDIAEKIDALKIDGVYLVKESKRYYPYEAVLRPVWLRGCSMLKKTKDGVILNLRIAPNSSKNEIIFAEGVLKVKITAQPVDGKANKALVEYLSKTFKIPKSSFEIIKGETSKDKTILIKCNDEEKLQKLKSFPD